MKKFLFYLLFWVLAVMSSTAIIGILTGLTLYFSMMNSDIGDPQLMAGVISVFVVNWILVLPIFTLIAYPTYYLIKRKLGLRYAWLIVTVLLIILYEFPVGKDWETLLLIKKNVASITLKFIAFSTFVLLALSLPDKLSASRKLRMQQQGVFD